MKITKRVSNTNLLFFWVCSAVAASWVHTTYADVTGGMLTGGSSLANGGSFIPIAPPTVLGNNAYNDDNVRAFNEVQNFTLTENLIMNIPASGLSSNVLGVGSVVSSHYIIYDPITTSTVEGTATFDEAVLGVIIENGQFDSSDNLLGSPGTNYAIASQGLEVNDAVTISGNTVSFSLFTNSPGDAIRVVTGTNPIPGINVCGTGTETLSGVITGGSAANIGSVFRQICDPVGPVGDDNFDSRDLFAFEEQQAAELVNDLFIDDVNIIEAGEFVSSFYVIWDPSGSETVIATLTFPDTIIAVIEDRTQLQASEFLGNASATYLNPTALGLETGDTTAINGNQLTIDFFASTPGDSIRVILGSASPSLSYNICEPQDETLSGALTGGTAATAGGTFSQLCEPIGPVGNNNQQANDLFAFEELQSFTLVNSLTLDDAVMATIPAGTEISSYYVAFDPASDKTVNGTITFPQNILGLATSTDLLVDSDYLGNPSATYLNPGLRGLEVGDIATFTDNVLTVNFGADNPGDYIRVIVSAAVDADGDGVDDSLDNCTLRSNADQRDTNGDGFGNACDPDIDNNGTVNFADIAAWTPFFNTACGDVDRDFDGDGSCNFGDYALFPQFFLQPPGPSGVAP